MLKQKITLKDIKAMDCETITPAVAAQVLGCDPQLLRVAARDAPHLRTSSAWVSGDCHRVSGQDPAAVFFAAYGWIKRITQEGMKDEKNETCRLAL